MATGKKYDFKIAQRASQWHVEITRKVTSRKVVTTKEQGGFASETQAKAWADECIAELSGTLSKSNKRHDIQRKNLEEIRRQRSSRRAEKTEKVKAAEAEAEVNQTIDTESSE